MDNVIKAPKNEEEHKDTDKQINNALFGSSETRRFASVLLRLPQVFDFKVWSYPAVAICFQSSDKVAEIVTKKRKNLGGETTTNTTWSSWMDNIIEAPKNEQEYKDIDEQINNAIYGPRNTRRRLPIFEEIGLSMNKVDDIVVS
ncbi:hypothetical protein JRO89_XS02G0017000 [Xanthoceras sorbifolium]|uniref:Uncharacterized protein n=1 Tax=Xanthoceras sorbifolium TaxID=99658 RepID=A0ABQ8IDY4_9ROSI|nr:hypothetical protein JRO89_XS02G0017000 [Xanthoceras sorbifolium]